MIGSALHSRVPRGRFQNLDTSFAVHGVEFLSGGRYVVTSGNNAVRVWELGKGSRDSFQSRTACLLPTHRKIEIPAAIVAARPK